MSLDPKILEEYKTAKEKGALIDFGFREKIRVDGKDRASFLHRMLTNDIEGLKPGEGCYACFLSVQAKVIADMIVFVSENHITLDVMPGLSKKIIDSLGKFVITDDVTFKEVTASRCDFVVLGPKSEDLIRALTKEYPKKNYSHQKVMITPTLPSPTSGEGKGGGLPCIFIYLDLFGAKAWAILSDKQNENSLRTALEKSSFKFLNSDTINILRVESGMPFYGIDFDENTIILEAGLDSAVSFTKGCYPGQEIVARMDSRAKFAKKLAYILMEGTGVPKSGDRITKDGKEIGKVTSAVFSPKFNQPLALGFIARDYLVPKTEIQIEVQKGSVLSDIKS